MWVYFLYKVHCSWPIGTNWLDAESHQQGIEVRKNWKRNKYVFGFELFMVFVDNKSLSIKILSLCCLCIDSVVQDILRLYIVLVLYWTSIYWKVFLIFCLILFTSWILKSNKNDSQCDAIRCNTTTNHSFEQYDRVESASLTLSGLLCLIHYNVQRVSVFPST